MAKQRPRLQVVLKRHNYTRNVLSWVIHFSEIFSASSRAVTAMQLLDYETNFFLSAAHSEKSVR